MIVQQLRACSGLCLRKGPVQGWGRLLLLLLLLRSLVGRDDRQRRYEMQQSCPACSSSASAGPWPAESSTANGANAAVRRQKKAAAVVPHLLARACVRATDGTASTGCVGEWITSASRPGPSGEARSCCTTAAKVGVHYYSVHIPRYVTYHAIHIGDVGDVSRSPHGR